MCGWLCLMPMVEKLSLLWFGLTAVCNVSADVSSFTLWHVSLYDQLMLEWLKFVIWIIFACSWENLELICFQLTILHPPIELTRMFLISKGLEFKSCELWPLDTWSGFLILYLHGFDISDGCAPLSCLILAAQCNLSWNEDPIMVPTAHWMGSRTDNVIYCPTDKIVNSFLWCLELITCCILSIGLSTIGCLDNVLADNSLQLRWELS